MQNNVDASYWVMGLAIQLPEPNNISFSLSFHINEALNSWDGQTGNGRTDNTWNSKIETPVDGIDYRWNGRESPK